MGQNTKNIIDINGKRYDAVSGSYIGESLAPKKTAVVHAVRHANAFRHGGQGGSIDGFRRVSRAEAVTVLKPIAAPKKSAPEKTSRHPAMTSVRKPHSPGMHVAPHSPQRAVTLMRGSVKKPVIKSPAVIKAQTRTDLLARAPMQAVAPKISYNSVNKPRHLHAERMIKSPVISRYSSGSGPVTAQAFQVALHPQPITRPAPQLKAAAASMSEVRPAPQAQKHAATAGHASAPARETYPATRSTHLPDRSAKKTDIFEQALAEARSHEETYEPSHHDAKHGGKKRGRLLRVVTGSLVGLFLVGFLAYQNAPSLSLKIASYRSGLHASMPAEKPSGFKFGYLDYQPGNVIVNFTSPADSRQFNITQKASNWDSQALLSNFVTTANSAYKTYQRAGRTVYVLGNNTATWVDSGIWYTVDGNSSLSSAQLLAVASSM